MRSHTELLDEWFVLFGAALKGRPEGMFFRELAQNLAAKQELLDGQPINLDDKAQQDRLARALDRVKALSESRRLPLVAA